MLCFVPLNNRCAPGYEYSQHIVINRLQERNMLINEWKYLPISIASATLILCGGCASPSPSMAGRYAKEVVPEYQLVDTRFGSGELKTDLSCATLEKEMVYLLSKMGCEVNTVAREEGQTQIEFSRPEAKGKLLLQTDSDGTETHTLNACSFTYRVNITKYPSTTDQDYHVNRIADELVASLKKTDPISHAVAGKR